MTRNPSPYALPSGGPRRYGFERHPKGSATVVMLAAMTAALVALILTPSSVSGISGLRDLALGLGVGLLLAGPVYRSIANWMERWAFERWARRTYAVSLGRKQAGALLKGRPTAEYSAVYERGRVYLHKTAGELPVLLPGIGVAAPSTDELPQVGRDLR